MGHALFDLVDEYCDGRMWNDGRTSYPTSAEEIPIYGNVWMSEAECLYDELNEGWSGGLCRPICHSGDPTSLWRYDNDTTNPDYMIACHQGCPPSYGNYTFGPACTRRINYVFDRWIDWYKTHKRIQGIAPEKGILIKFHINDEENIEVLNSEVVNGYPDNQLETKKFIGEIISSEAEIIQKFGISDPRIIQYTAKTDNGLTQLMETNFTIIIPLYEGIQKLRILDSITDEEKILVDLNNTIYDYCTNLNYEPADCLKLDFDVDGIYDIEDNCPSVYNPNQIDSDNNGIGNACETGQSPEILWLLILAIISSILIIFPFAPLLI